LRMISMTRDEIAARAGRVAEEVSAVRGFSATLEDGESVVGGGSTPGQTLPTRLVAVTHERLGAKSLEAGLRRNSPPVIARIENDRLLLDLRTVFEAQEDVIIHAFEAIGVNDE